MCRLVTKRPESLEDTETAICMVRLLSQASQQKENNRKDPTLRHQFSKSPVLYWAVQRLLSNPSVPFVALLACPMQNALSSTH